MRITLTYRQKLRMKKFLKWTAILLTILIAALVLFLIFVERYVVYTKDGVYIDYSRSAAQLQADTPAPASTSAPMDVEIYHETPVPSTDGSALVRGYLITAEDLENVDDVLNQVPQMQSGSTVLLELKSPSGRLYYSSNLADTTSADIDTEAVGRLIAALKKQNCMPVALISAFADDLFAQYHTDSALMLEDGSFWVGAHNSYWLDPASEEVYTYLEQITEELSRKGFTEIAFADFYLPEDKNIVYESEVSRTEVTVNAARRLTERFAGSNLVISFLTESADFPSDALSGRLYVRNADASQVEHYATVYQSDGWDVKTNLVFITTSKDSRFVEYGTLSPLG